MSWSNIAFSGLETSGDDKDDNNESTCEWTGGVEDVGTPRNFAGKFCEAEAKAAEEERMAEERKKIEEMERRKQAEEMERRRCDDDSRKEEEKLEQRRKLDDQARRDENENEQQEEEQRKAAQAAKFAASKIVMDSDDETETEKVRQMISALSNIEIGAKVLGTQKSKTVAHLVRACRG